MSDKITDDSIREELLEHYRLCLDITKTLKKDIKKGKINDKTVRTLEANNKLLLNINNVYNSLKENEKDKYSVEDSLNYIKEQIQDQVKK